jgi:H+/Cl- antiporter ClcA
LTRPGRRSRTYTSLLYVVLGIMGGLVGVLLVRFLFPVVLESNFLFALLVIAFFVVAAVLAFRAYKRGAGS